MVSESNHYQRHLFLVAIVVIMSSLHSCYYYKVSSSSYPRDEELSPVTVPAKTIIVHSGSLAFEIDNISLENDTLSGKYVAYHGLPHKKKTFPGLNSSNRYSKTGSEKYIYNEVHLYVQIPLVPGRELTRFALSDIYRFDIYNKDKKMTALATGLAVGVGVIYILRDVIH